MQHLILSLILTAGLVVSCSNGSSKNDLKTWSEPNGKLKVLSTTAMIDDVVHRIGKEHIDTLTLIGGELDPHSYQLIKGDDEKLSSASLIFYNGLGLEHGPSLARHLHDNDKAIALGDRIASGDSSQSLVLHVDGQLDPHIWMDISLWMRTVPIIVAELSQRDPANAAAYKTNGDALYGEMQAVHDEIRQQLQHLPDAKRYLVTSHDAFNYFTRAYLAADGETTFDSWSRRFAAPEGLAPDSQLSATDIQKIIDHLLQYKVNVIFPESNVSRDSIRKILQAGQEKGLKLTIADVALYGDAMGRPGSDGDSYLKMIKHNANTLSQYLGHNG